MVVPVYSSHTSALSLWQSALHEVLSQQAEQQDSAHSGIGVTALTPEMLATAQVVKQFDHTGNFDAAHAAPAPVEAHAAAGGVAQAVAPPAPSSVAMQCAKLAAQIAYYSVTDRAKADILRQEFS